MNRCNLALVISLNLFLVNSLSFNPVNVSLHIYFNTQSLLYQAHTKTQNTKTAPSYATIKVKMLTLHLGKSYSHLLQTYILLAARD